MYTRTIRYKNWTTRNCLEIYERRNLNAFKFQLSDNWAENDAKTVQITEV